MIRALAFCLFFLPGVALGQEPSFVALSGADVVVLGEVHDNPAHHTWQGEALRALSPAAVVFEMLTPDQAAMVTPASRIDLDALGVAIGWAESGWPEFALYRPVFAALGAAAVYGAALPYDAVRGAIEDGAAARFDGDAVRFGLDEPLPGDQQARRERLQAGAHCDALPEALLPGMVEAQRLRDASFAATVLEALSETGGPVVLITGNGHARMDWGVPGVIARAAPGVTVISVGQVEAQPEAQAPFDVWRVTPSVDREDPCAGFGTG
ncbi:MAG: hypothetical protein COW55_05335 [Rhodobacteraceae bacterium CG17_big_fil_post_rev_8_21_14_2_50_65_11]|nr:MAG: hypothetical protein COW55_05335 [Rhodobacteraceae bacterium CG17_big_fil_post_rev_8_21_14_2_50_65_11]